MVGEQEDGGHSPAIAQRPARGARSSAEAHLMIPTPVSLTVFPDDCDAFGHLNQAAFLTLFERARWQALALGPGMDLFQRAGVWPAVRQGHHRLPRPGVPRPGRFASSRWSPGWAAPASPCDRWPGATRTRRSSRPWSPSSSASIERAGAVPVPPSVMEFLAPGPAAIGSGPPRRITVHGVELALEERGGGPAILFIHGYPFDRTLWRHQLGAFDGMADPHPRPARARAIRRPGPRLQHGHLHR